MSTTTISCTAATGEKIAVNLAQFPRKVMAFRGLRRAAVCLALVDYRQSGNLRGLPACDDGSLAVILTRRAGNLRNHAGQWALPGGSVDDGELPQQAALRELGEEVGLNLTEKRVLGCLDDFVTRSGFHITPVVVWGGEVDELVKNPLEVASIHRIPCAEFFRRDAPIYARGEDELRPILYMPVGTTSIATPTAALLYQFKEVALCGVNTRVSHFDQPRFAWR